DRRVALPGIVGTHGRVREPIGPAMRQQVADVAEDAAEFVREHERNFRLTRRRQDVTTSRTGRAASHAIVRSSPSRSVTRGSNPSARTFEMSAYQRAVSPANDRPLGRIRIFGYPISSAINRARSSRRTGWPDATLYSSPLAPSVATIVKPRTASSMKR